VQDPLLYSAYGDNNLADFISPAEMAYLQHWNIDFIGGDVSALR